MFPAASSTTYEPRRRSTRGARAAHSHQMRGVRRQVLHLGTCAISPRARHGLSVRDSTVAFSPGGSNTPPLRGTAFIRSTPLIRLQDHEVVVVHDDMVIHRRNFPAWKQRNPAAVVTSMISRLVALTISES